MFQDCGGMGHCCSTYSVAQTFKWYSLHSPLQPTHYVRLVYYIYFHSLTAILTLAFPRQYFAEEVNV
jgi:hypothetical protein